MKNEQLNLLAEKLGTTVEYLWQVLLTQAPIDATITLIQIILIAIVTFVFIKYHFKFSKKQGEYNESKYENSEGLCLSMIMLGVLLLILNIACFFCINDVINGYFNPEYWALSKIISSVNN